ncbi:MAG TPA: hypothetical protein VMZ25_00025, partial [Terriglobales bacterium]|nr:hypothetical protein [Terriglobales bacterium]
MSSTMALSVLQIAYYPGLLETRHAMLEHDGYQVTSTLGNEEGMLAAAKGSFDVIVVGFSTTYARRNNMVKWLKRHAPHIPIVVLMANSNERFPDADCVTFSEDPTEWLSAVRGACQAKPD